METTAECLARLDRELAATMGRLAALKSCTATWNPPCEPRLPFPDWIELQASMVRLNRTPAAEWLAAKIDDLAKTARCLSALTPEDYDDREATYEGWIRDREREREDQDFSFCGPL